MLGAYLLTENNANIMLHKKNVYDLRVCHYFVLRSRSFKKVYTLFLLLLFKERKHSWFLLYKKISYELRVCHEPKVHLCKLRKIVVIVLKNT